MSESDFDRATAVSATGDGHYAVQIDPAWSIRGHPNGGYLMAIMARACLAALPADVPMDPLAMSVSFASAPGPGPAEVSIEVIRQGRAVSVCRARLSQGDEPRLEGLVTCGRLPTEITTVYDGSTMPDLPDRQHCPVLATEGPGFAAPLMGLVREELDPAGLGWARGRPGGQSEIKGYLSLMDGRDPDPLFLLLAVDAAPPPSFDLGVQGWVPTLQMSAWIRRRPAPGSLVVRSRANLVTVGADGLGFTDETCELWDSAGALVATGHQLAGLRMRPPP